MKRAGVWITWISIVVILGSAIGGIWMTASGFLSIFGGSSNALELSGPGNSIEHDFEAGTEWQLYTYGADGVYVGPVPSCTMDAGPAPVQEGTAIRNSITIGAQSRISFASIVFVESGTYRFSCDQSGVTMMPVSSVVGDSLGIFIGMTILTTGVFFGLFGLIIGIFLWVFGAGRQRRESQNPGVTFQGVIGSNPGVIGSSRPAGENKPPGVTFH